MLALGLLLAPALAQDAPRDPKPEQEFEYEEVTVIDIERGLDVAARVAKAEATIVFVADPPTGPSLLHLRKDFRREMKQSADAVK